MSGADDLGASSVARGTMLERSRFEGREQSPCQGNVMPLMLQLANHLALVTDMLLATEHVPLGDSLMSR